MRRSGRMKDGARGRPIENYGKKEQKELLDNTLPNPHPCTAGNKDEGHKYGDKTIQRRKMSTKHTQDK